MGLCRGQHELIACSFFVFKGNYRARASFEKTPLLGIFFTSLRRGAVREGSSSGRTGGVLTALCVPVHSAERRAGRVFGSAHTEPAPRSIRHLPLIAVRSHTVSTLPSPSIWSADCFEHRERAGVDLFLQSQAVGQNRSYSKAEQHCRKIWPTAPADGPAPGTKAGDGGVQRSSADHGGVTPSIRPRAFLALCGHAGCTVRVCTSVAPRGLPRVLLKGPAAFHLPLLR